MNDIKILKIPQIHLKRTISTYRTLTYLTNEAILLCLKYFGRIFSAKSLVFFTINASPSSFQEIISLYSSF